MLQRPFKIASWVVLVMGTAPLYLETVIEGFTGEHHVSWFEFALVMLALSLTASLVLAVTAAITRTRVVFPYVLVIVYLFLCAFFWLGASGCARCKGPDAELNSDMNSIQTQSEIFYGSTGNNSYGVPVALATSANACEISGSAFAYPENMRAIASILALHSQIACISTGPMGAATAYAFEATIPSSGSENRLYYCIDSLGDSQVVSEPLTSSVCPKAVSSPTTPPGGTGGVYDVHQVNCVPQNVYDLWIKEGMVPGGGSITVCPK